MAKSVKTKKHGPLKNAILSDRGLHLERMRILSEQNNLNFGMPVFSFLNESGKSIAVKVGQRCPICRKRVRGLHHEDGDHHRGIAVK